MWKIALFLTLVSIPIAAKAMPCVGIGLLCAPISGIAIFSQPTDIQWGDGTAITWGDGTTAQWSGS